MIDPVNKNVYLTKYKDINTGKRVLLSKNDVTAIPRIQGLFKESLAQNYDLLIGLHAHGSNLQIINACKKYHKDFLLLPCCVIDEPLIKKPDINWLQSLIDYAVDQGFKVKQDTLNFKGQNILIYSDKNLRKMSYL